MAHTFIVSMGLQMSVAGDVLTYPNLRCDQATKGGTFAGDDGDPRTEVSLNPVRSLPNFRTGVDLQTRMGSL
jgi:hypothetical protein